jgi:ElaB/YqjD/DUF883 family membrane-anchored ribosome-binding protein
VSNNDQTVRVNIDERKIGKAAGDATGRQLDGRLENMERQMKQTKEAVQSLSGDIEHLERRIGEVEQTKARAERQAIEGLKETLQEQVQEKRQEYERRIGEVLDDYRGSIERLKSRFLNSISGRGDHFDSVEDEFGEALDARSEVVEKTAELGDSPAQTYESRTRAVLESRNEFLGTIDSFLEDREETASTIESMRTTVAGISGATTVTVPFWVYGVETDGREELKVLPVADCGEPDGSPTRANPYGDYLRPHPEHGFEDMAEAVHQYVVRDEVRDRLADRDDDAYADPSALRDGGVRERFVEALREFELGRGGSKTSQEPEAAAEVSADD